MRILWISPKGEGWALAAALRSEGNKVVYFCPDPHNKRADGVLPRATLSNWREMLGKADAIYVDSNFDSRRTRRSWAPSAWVEDIWSAVRALGKERAYSGPLPATELLAHDRRYLKKILGRLGLELGKLGNTLQLHVGGDGDVHGQLGDQLIPARPSAPQMADVVKVLAYLRSLRYNGPVSFEIDEEGHVLQVLACFTYPAAFAQVHVKQVPDAVGVLVRTVRSTDEIDPDERLWGLNVWRTPDELVAAGNLIGYATKTTTKETMP